MSRIVLEINGQLTSELDLLAQLLKCTPSAIVEEALSVYFAERSALAGDVAEGLPICSIDPVKILPASPKPPSQRKHTAFGILQGQLEVDGVPVTDGLEYQKKMRGR